MPCLVTQHQLSLRNYKYCWDYPRFSAGAQKIPSIFTGCFIVNSSQISASIWNILAIKLTGAGNEIQLTDAIAKLMETETVEAYCMVGKSHDCGGKIGYMNAFAEYSLRDKTRGAEFRANLVKLLAQYPETSA